MSNATCAAETDKLFRFDRQLAKELEQLGMKDRLP
jgi:hypothetical protein